MSYENLKDKTYQLFHSLQHEEVPSQFGETTAGEKGILHLLHKSYPAAISSGDLSSMLHVCTGRIGNALKSLEKKNLIRRDKDKKDKRKVLVSLTDYGYQKIDTQLKQVNDFFDELIKRYGEERFSKLLDELVIPIKC